MKKLLADFRDELSKNVMAAEDWELFWFIIALVVAAFTAIVCVQVLLGIA